MNLRGSRKNRGGRRDVPVGDDVEREVFLDPVLIQLVLGVEQLRVVVHEVIAMDLRLVCLSRSLLLRFLHTVAEEGWVKLVQ